MSTTGDHQYEADIRRTTHGVAHISAADWGSLGYGQGYAMAQDHLPTVADQIVKVRSERALFHGRGPDDSYLALDLGYQMIGVRDRAPQLRDAQPRHIRAMVSGYTAGYNRAVAEAQTAGSLPDWCAGAPWIRPVDELDMWTYFVDVGLLASGRNLAEIIGRAEAPGPDGPKEPSPIAALGGGAGASNGWAFGGDATASGHGIVMANPHFPWGGEARFWENHLQIPGEIDCYGVSLLGTPGIQMGFNEGVAWCHTFSRGHRFTLARLELDPTDPTAYRYGDDIRPMTSTDLVVDVVGDDGTISQVSRTLWRSHHGPMINLPLLGWGLDVGFAYRDANLDNDHVLSQFLGMAQATTMEEFQEVFATRQGMPWVNTLAADRTGRSWYIDASPTPALSAQGEANYRDRVANDLVAALLLESRVAMLDGSNPQDEWQDDPGARSPGLLPYERFPQIERRDYVVNANDSHWLTHLDDRLEGYSALHGMEGTPRSLRTRQNLAVASQLAASGTLDIDATIDAVLSNASLSADLLLDDVLARAADVPDLADAVAVLSTWDRAFDLVSIGAALWREFMAGYEPAAYLHAGALFAEPFDPQQPATTPTGLAAAPADGPDPVVDALRTAVERLGQAGVAIDAPLGDVQWAQRGDERVAVHGGTECDGVLNILSPIGSLASLSLEPEPAPLASVEDRTARTGLTEGGYRCTYGTSFLMAVELTDDGPVAKGFLAYGQSGDTRSPHHVDGTEAYAAKDVRPLLFRDADIDADPTMERTTLRG